MNQNRINKVIQNMVADGLTQIIVSAPASFYYLTGVWPHAGERLYALYLNVDGTAVVFANELFGGAVETGITVKYHKDTQNPVADIAAQVKGGEIGIDKFWSAKFVIGLLEALPGLVVRHGSPPVDRARMCKEPDEIQAMRNASRLNDQVMAYIIEQTKALAARGEQVSELELEALMLAKYDELGFGKGEGLIASFGANGADPHHGPDKSILCAGDSIVFDIFMPHTRYWADMTRTVFYKTASDEQRKVYEIVKNANEAAEAIIKPGVPMCEFDKTARDYIAGEGYGEYFTHRLGHGIGLECHEPPDNSAADKTIALPGMVFSVEPGIYLPGKFGVRVEDLVLVTEDGCEILNAYPKDLLIIG